MASTERQKRTRVKYINLMGEVRRRLDFLIRLHENPYKLPRQPASELGYLELRMICECVALACLIVHGDDTAGILSAKMKSAHEADRILRTLERLHPRFYPEPGLPSERDGGGKAFVPRAAGDYMTKEELLQLYRECGKHLHRGNYERAQKFSTLDFEPIKAATDKLINLLRFHRIALLGSDDELWIAMIDPEIGDVRGTLERPLRDH
jgi:hypothetical protein